MTGIASLPLKTLHLNEFPINAVGLKALAKANTLDELEFYDCRLTDAALVELEPARHLKKLTFKLSELSDRAVAKLREALPSCEIQNHR